MSAANYYLQSPFRMSIIVFSVFVFVAVARVSDAALIIQTTTVEVPALHSVELNAAISEVKSSLRLDSKHRTSVWAQAWVHREKPDTRSSLADEFRGPVIYTNDVRRLRLRGCLYLMRGEYALGIADLDRVIGIVTDCKDDFYNRGTAYLRQGELERAIADLTMAIRLDRTYAPAFRNRAAAYAKLARFKEAIADYDQVVILDPDNGEVFKHRGTAREAVGDNEGAISDYTESILLDATESEVHVRRASAYTKARKTDLAIADCDRAIELDAKAAFAFFLRARAHASKGNAQAAIADYSQAVHLDPKNTDALFGRGLAYGDNGQSDREIADYTEVIRLNPSIKNVFYFRAVAYLRKSDYVHAIADYEQAILVDPTNGPAHNELAWLYATCTREELFNAKRAMELATKACDLSGWKNQNEIDTLAAAYAASGDFERAITWQEKALALNPADADFQKSGQERLQLYRNRRPYRSEPVTSSP